MTTPTRAEIERMIEVAEKATPGEWTLFTDPEGDAEIVYGGEWTGCDYDDEVFREVCRVIVKLPVEKYGYGCAWASEPNGKYIAQCSPDRIIPILRLALEALAVRESMAQLAESQLQKEIDGTIALVEDQL